MSINEADALEIINGSDMDAEDLLVEVDRDFPDAKYYSANGTLCLMLGDSHGGGKFGVAQQELVALQTNNPDIGGGDW